MTAQLQFRNLTLGYDRHPAVHHLDGAVAGRRADGGGRPERRRQVDAVQGHRRRASSRSPAASSAAACAPRDIAYLPQVAEIDRTLPDQRLRHGGDGAVARAPACSAASAARTATRCERAIAAVGLTGFEARPIGTLSGGQMQRMLFARLLLQDARVIVLDEPFNAIDAKTCRRSAAIWCGAGTREQRTVLAALHDLDLVKANFPETLLLAREPVAWGATADVLTAGELLKARRMCEAFDEQAAGLRGRAA